MFQLWLLRVGNSFTWLLHSFDRFPSIILYFLASKLFSITRHILYISWPGHLCISLRNPGSFYWRMILATMIGLVGMIVTGNGISSFFYFNHLMDVCIRAKSLQSCPTLCDRVYELQPARFLCPWDFPGKYIGVGCRALFQGTTWEAQWMCCSILLLVGFVIP